LEYDTYYPHNQKIESPYTVLNIGTYSHPRILPIPLINMNTTMNTQNTTLLGPAGSNTSVTDIPSLVEMPESDPPSDSDSMPELKAIPVALNPLEQEIASILISLIKHESAGEKQEALDDACKIMDLNPSNAAAAEAIVRLMRPTEIIAAPGSDHLQARTVMINIELLFPEGHFNLQKRFSEITEAASAAGKKIFSEPIDLKELGITYIVCSQPKCGTKAVVITRVSDGSWFTKFTGGQIRVDTKRMEGSVGPVNVYTEKLIVDFKMNESGVWELTNAVSPPPPHALATGPMKRATTLAHFIGTYTNPTFMAKKFSNESNGEELTIVSQKEIETTEEDSEKMVCRGDAATRMPKETTMPCIPLKLSELTDFKMVEQEMNQEITATNVFLEEGEESKCGDGDRIACLISKNTPFFTRHLKVYGKNRENLVVIIGEDEKEFPWAACSEHWESLITTLGDVCKPTVEIE